MMACPYDTNGDGDCAVCSHPRVICTGDGPAFGEEDDPFAAFTEGFTKIDSGSLTVGVGRWDGEHWIYEETTHPAVACTPPPCPPEETFEAGPLVPLDECGHDHGPSVFSEWYCQADAAGITTTHCSPENPIHSSPCGWMT